MRSIKMGLLLVCSLFISVVYSMEMPKMKEIVRPVFPNHRLSMLEVGGIGDGIFDNTAAFERAMEQLEAEGGGRLEVPFGVWLTGPITFRSNVEMHLQLGALILFTPNLDAYPLVKTSFEGQTAFRCQSPISGRGLRNVAITGKGAINGSGDAWRPVKKMKVTEAHWKSLLQSGGGLADPGLWYPTDKALKGANAQWPSDLNEDEQVAYMNSMKDFLRPVMVSFIECSNVWLEGVLFENSPSWNIHPLMCTNVLVEGITVRNPHYAQNGDGLDLESCKNVWVLNSTFDVGDDAICLKSGKDEEGRKRGMPTEQVWVEGCRVFSGHGGFVVGSEMSGGVRDVVVKNCQFIGTDIGLRFKSTRGRGGVVERVWVDGVSMFNIKREAFLFNLYYGQKAPMDGSKEPMTYMASEETPVFKDIYVTNVISNSSERPLLFNGLPEMPISGIRITNSSFSSRLPSYLSESQDVEMENVAFLVEDGPALLFHQVERVAMHRMNLQSKAETPIEIKGDRSKKIQLDGLDVP